MKTYSKYKKSNKKKYIIVAVAVAILVCALLLLELTNVTNFYSQPAKTIGGQSEEINYGPPTEAELKAGDEQKQTISDQQDNQTKSPNTATVIVTGAEQSGDIVEVTAYISNVYKDGICTIRFEQGSSVVAKTTTAYRDVTTTICTNPLIPRSEFPAAGDWRLTVSYTSSDGIAGQSEQKTVKVE